MFQVLNFHTKCLLDNYSDNSMTLLDIFFIFFVFGGSLPLYGLWNINGITITAKIMKKLKIC